MSLVNRWLCSGLVALIAGSARAAPLPTPGTAVNTDNVHRQAVTVLLREPSGQHLGSGVLVGTAPQGVWVVTNRHVVSSQNIVCVVTADRTAKPSLVMPRSLRQNLKNLDLALLWLSMPRATQVLVASIRETEHGQDAVPLVVATGFPTPLNYSIDGPVYSERLGLIVPILKAPLEGGLDLAYTSMVDKGMSGGGLFLGSELIGVNNAHRDPLWPGQWRDTRGRAVDERLNQALDLVSLGISAKHITQAVKATSPPSGSELSRLTGVECNKTMPSGNPGKSISKTKQAW